MSAKINITSIGFTKTSAQGFFDRLKAGGVKRVFDVRLHNTSQLAGFAKAEDLRYFLKEIGGIGYQHVPLMAPEADMLDIYKKHGGSWLAYEAAFLGLMERRKIEERLKPEQLEGVCLLCSEDQPHHCHRRLVVDYLNRKWDGVLSVRHL